MAGILPASDPHRSTQEAACDRLHRWAHELDAPGKTLDVITRLQRAADAMRERADAGADVALAACHAEPAMAALRAALLKLEEGL